MSILNRPNDGNHSILIALFKCLVAHDGQLPRETLIGLCAPSSAVPSSDQAEKTLRTWQKLGLFQEEDGGNISIVSCSSTDKEEPEQAAAKLPATLRRLLLAEENNRGLWEKESSESTDFTRAMSWMLAQNVYTVPGGSHPLIETLEAQQIRNQEVRIFQNDTRWVGFKAWASFLGFGWRSAVPQKNTLIIDPRVAVQDALSDLYADSRELPANEFFQKLTKRLPVVDGGQYRKEVEAKISTANWEKPGSNEISTSLSRALMQLHETGVITMVSKDDADKKILLGRNGEIRRVSHISFNGRG